MLVRIDISHSQITHVPTGEQLRTLLSVSNTDALQAVFEVRNGLPPAQHSLMFPMPSRATLPPADPDTHARACLPQRARSQPGWSPTAVSRQQLRQPLYGTPWEDVLPAHVAALAALAEGKAGDAYGHLITCVQPFIKVRPFAGLAQRSEPRHAKQRPVPCSRPS